jgi:hypothetical protein
VKLNVTFDKHEIKKLYRRYLYLIESEVVVASGFWDEVPGAQAPQNFLNMPDHSFCAKV